MGIKCFIDLHNFNEVGAFIMCAGNKVELNTEAEDGLGDIVYLWVAQGVVVYVGQTNSFHNRFTTHETHLTEHLKSYDEIVKPRAKYITAVESMNSNNGSLEIFIRKAKKITLFEKEVSLRKTEEDACIAVFNYKNLKDIGFLKCNQHLPDVPTDDDGESIKMHYKWLENPPLNEF